MTATFIKATARRLFSKTNRKFSHFRCTARKIILCLKKSRISTSNFPTKRRTTNISKRSNKDCREFLCTIADIIFYLGGADPFEKDKLGRLSLTFQGLKKRDEMVLRFAKENQTPIVTVMSGGYAADIKDTVEIHCNTIRAVKDIFF